MWTYEISIMNLRYYYNLLKIFDINLATVNYVNDDGRVIYG